MIPYHLFARMILESATSHAKMPCYQSKGTGTETSSLTQSAMQQARAAVTGILSAPLHQEKSGVDTPRSSRSSG